MFFFDEIHFTQIIYYRLYLVLTKDYNLVIPEKNGVAKIENKTVNAPIKEASSSEVEKFQRKKHHSMHWYVRKFFVRLESILGYRITARGTDLVA